MTTRVVNRAEGPSTSSAATAVASLVVDAGWIRVEPPWVYSTRPVAGSMTSAPACLPSVPEPSTPDRAAARPRLVGTGAEDGAPASTWLAAAAGRVATRGMFHRASRAGIRVATAAPAPRVKTLIMASVITMMAWSRFGNGRFTTGRFTNADPLTRCLDSGSGAQPTPPGPVNQNGGLVHVQAPESITFAARERHRGIRCTHRDPQRATQQV